MLIPDQLFSGKGKWGNAEGGYYWVLSFKNSQIVFCCERSVESYNPLSIANEINETGCAIIVWPCYIITHMVKWYPR